jgi:hypothetical protein
MGDGHAVHVPRKLGDGEFHPPNARRRFDLPHRPADQRARRQRGHRHRHAAEKLTPRRLNRENRCTRNGERFTFDHVPKPAAHEHEEFNQDQHRQDEQMPQEDRGVELRRDRRTRPANPCGEETDEEEVAEHQPDPDSQQTPPQPGTRQRAQAPVGRPPPERVGAEHHQTDQGVEHKSR